MVKRIMPLLVVLLSLSVAAGSALALQSTQIPLAGSAIPQFVQPLPILSVSPFANPPAPNPPYLKAINTVSGNTSLTVTMCEFDSNILPPGTFAVGIRPLTRVWGYIVGSTCPATARETYLGPVIVNNRGSSTDITWVNNLGSVATTGVLAYKYSTDQTLHWADPKNDEANNCSMTGGVPAYQSTCAQNYDGPIPAVVHLHGGEVPPELDGGPDAWFTSDGTKKGHGYYSYSGAANNSAIYKYPNTQEAGPLWFHDHTLGATRLNVYAGLAGGYYLQDRSIIPVSAGGTCTASCLPGNLQSLSEVVPIVLQDRMFDTQGQLFFPADSAGGLLRTTNPDHPYWVPEFVGDTIVVNGKAWPFLNVEAKRYRFLFLNGSNARTYEMFLTNQATGAMGPPFWVIGTDGGYLNAPVKIDPALGQRLVIMSGERYEVIIDFAGLAGQNLIIRNTGKTPYPAGKAPQGSTTGRIMQFRVGATSATLDPTFNPATPGVAVRPTPMVRLANPATGTLAVTAQKTRQLTLNEVLKPKSTATDPVTGLLTAYPGGPLEILVNNTKWSGMPRTLNDFTPIVVGGTTTNYSELPNEGDTEVWEIVNTTADAHPMHLHLVQFQLMNRQNYNTSNYLKAYAAAFPTKVYQPGFGPPLNYSTGNLRALGGNPDIIPYLQGAAKLPVPYETGWKDTIMVPPGMVTRLAVRWAPTDLLASTPPANAFFPFVPDGAINPYGYVWHCHIIDHEDNEMMRPTYVWANPNAPATRAYTTY